MARRARCGRGRRSRAGSAPPDSRCAACTRGCPSRAAHWRWSDESGSSRSSYRSSSCPRWSLAQRTLERDARESAASGAPSLVSEGLQWVSQVLLQLAVQVVEPVVLAGADAVALSALEELLLEYSPPQMAEGLAWDTWDTQLVRKGRIQAAVQKVDRKVETSAVGRAESVQ